MPTDDAKPLRATLPNSFRLLMRDVPDDLLIGNILSQMLSGQEECKISLAHLPRDVGGGGQQIAVALLWMSHALARAAFEAHRDT
jgi:hypothetical protein